MRRTKRLARGMTLIEIMVVVAILGLLMSSVGVYAFGRLKAAQIKDTKLIIKNVVEAVSHFQTENMNACPRSLDELYQQKLLTKQPVDAWGGPLQLKCPGEHDSDGADVVSMGADKQPGTADDIKSWEL